MISMIKVKSPATGWMTRIDDNVFLVDTGRSKVDWSSALNS